MTRACRALIVVLVLWLVSPVLPATGAPSGTAVVVPMVVDELVPQVAGRPAEFTATYLQDGQPVPGEELTLLLAPAGSTSYVEAGRAVTDEHGVATVSSVLDRNATVQWQVSSEPTVTSTPYVVQIAPAVTREARDRTLRRGQRLVVRGRTFPVKAGCTIQLWRGELRPLMVGPRPVRLASSTVRADGSYRLVRRFHHRLRGRVVVVVPPCSDNGRGLSAYLRLRVR